MAPGSSGSGPRAAAPTRGLGAARALSARPVLNLPALKSGFDQFLSRQNDIYHILNMLVGKCISASPAVCFWRNGEQKEYEQEEKRSCGILEKGKR